MRIIEKMSNVHMNTICIDCGDLYITVEKRGSFDNIQQYSWSETSPNEGHEMGYNSKLITKDLILQRIEMLAGDKISDAEALAVKLFFKN